MFNQIQVIGHLTKDVELRYLPSGTVVAKSSIASNHKTRANDGSIHEETCFLDFSIFGRMAEIANQYLSKGSKVLVVGRLVQNNWTDSNGNNRTNYFIRVDSIKFLDPKQEPKEEVAQATQKKPEAPKVAQTATKNTTSVNQINDDEVEDLPF
ncbi:single-stranded DNA-binding protein [Campylobacter lari]|uniref:single-stranded DNA-binding protein n=1 Tax=Campylobacter lari TaxID=201 RepID=UPI0012C74705|nr:single-stranded DNA-binding protein [Campylobacter lari]EAK0799697.1 single-stranded DNA-binding protein [Campylobacter lari]EAL0061515.1 single-stranded DNA-binding protein [Campylobacter lari]EIV5071127.1 single-stranded DNA-binding protein [Campylobacter lari]EKL1317301.1 single-stranded DNA-binding protein [Campylobacter lari]MCV3397826.1 single-stranded DNA-binding protein [Campylobacter lari]